LKVFISYARRNRRDIDQLFEHLGVLGCDVWIDKSLHGGQDWWEEILKQIANCDTFIATISRDSLNSTACRREFDWAEALGKPVLPVAVEPLPKALPRRFGKRQIIDYSSPAERDRAALTLAGGLATLPLPPPLPDPLPEPPGAPMSYLTDLIDLVTQSEPLDHAQQRDILNQLEPAFTSVDPQERRGGHDILELLSSRDDLYADMYRTLNRLKEMDIAPGDDGNAVKAIGASDDFQEPTATAVEPSDQSVTGARTPPQTSNGSDVDATPPPVARAGATATKPPQLSLTSGSPKTRVALRYSDSGTESMLLFFTRAVDLAYVGMVPFTLGLAYGLPLRVAGVAQSAGPSHSVVLKKRLHESESPPRIATVFGSSGHFVGWHWARAAGLDVVFIDLSPLDQVRAFHQGYIQGIASWEPHVSACLNDSSEIVFSADDLPFTLLDLIVTSEDSAPRAREIDRIVEMHRQISATLADAPRDVDIEYVMEFLGTRWSHEASRQLLDEAFKSAASEHLEQYLDDVEIGVAAVREFAVATGLGTSAWSQPREKGDIIGISHWERQTRSKHTGDLRVGYSDDLMCTPLMLGRLAHPLAETCGITFVRQPRREVERVAELSETLRGPVLQARELISTDPALATIKMARLVEINLRKVAEQAMGSNAPKQVSAVIGALEERGILPPLVASSAHWIQSVCNVAAHQEDLSEATASAAMTHLLEILEWLEENQKTTEIHCPRCSGRLQSEWLVCPHCAVRLERHCEECHLAIDQSWKACPGCGSSMTGHEGHAKG
jgi:hypothetical protein